jgi:hypothetical protein
VVAVDYARAHCSNAVIAQHLYLASGVPRDECAGGAA